MYKNFIIKVFLIVAIIYVGYVYIIENKKMWFLDSEYPMWVHVKEIMNGTNQEYKILVLGDSGAKAAFIPNQEPDKKAVNLALGGSTPIESYFILKNYLVHNKKPSKIILSFGTGHLNGSNTYWQRTVKFDFLTPNEYKEIDKIAKKYSEKEILSARRTYSDYKKIPSLYGESLLYGILNQRWTTNKKILEDCKDSHGHYFFGKLNTAPGYPSSLFENKMQRVFHVSKLQNYYLIQLLKLANKYNIKIYFYKMPYIESIHKYREEEYIKTYEDYLVNLSFSFGMKVCNKLWYLSDDNFGDNDHLYKGSVFVTNEIYKCIE